MEKNEKIALVGGGFALMIALLIMSSSVIQAACSDWSKGLSDKYYTLNYKLESYVKTHPDANKQMSDTMANEWMTYQRELHEYHLICYPMGARIT